MSDAKFEQSSPQDLPLTSSQDGLWFARKLDPDNPSFNIAEYADIHGEFDEAVLLRAVRHAEREMEALRVTFGERDGVPFQRVHSGGVLAYDFVDLSHCERPCDEALRRMERDLARPSDVAEGPLIRLTLYRLAPHRHLFHQQVHHLALDGYGAVLALSRIAEVYSALVASPGTPVPLVPAPLAPLGEEERAYRESQDRAEDARFWAEYLEDAPAATGLFDSSAPLGHGFVVAGRDAPPVDAARLKAAAKEARVAWPTLFMAAMGIYLHRGRGLGEVVLGLPVTGRRTKRARTTPTMVSNILPMRLRVSPSDLVSDVARRASAEARQVLRHQRYPSEQLRRDLGMSGTTRRLAGPSVNVLAFDDALRFGAATATLHNLSIGPVEDLALAVHASYGDGGLRIELLGNPDLHDSAELEAQRERFGRLAAALADDPHRSVGSLKFLGDDEHRRIIGLGSGTPGRAGATEDAATLPEQFARQVRATPDATAVVSGDERLTFAELDARVAELTSALVRGGARPGTRVGVGLHRCTGLVVAMLAVMRSGAAYLPLDPSYPADRLTHMVRDAEPVALIASAGTAARMDPSGALPLIDPRPGHAGSGEGDHADGTGGTPHAPVAAGSHDAAYVIYTSGSTGRPKGVVVEHRSLANLLAHHRSEAHALARDTLERGLRVALTAATSFDASWDPVLWMVAGHELHIVDDTVRRDPEALVAFLIAERIDAIETTPTYLRQMLLAGLLTSPHHRPRVVALGGEPVDEQLWQDLAARRDLLVFNFYGPTETTVDAVTARVTDTTSPVIGRPVDGARAYVLDSALHPLPQGGTGELYLSGEGVARGYAGRPDLTAERFLPDPFGPPGSRMYRTGDLARWSSGGSLEFLGRSDSQVKIRGHRVETGEIEAALRRLPGVGEAAVALVAPGDGPQRLSAYLVPGPDGASPEPADVREALHQVLPEHMVPTAYATVDRLPLTPNGKLDTARLPAAQPVAAGGGEPRTPAEERMCALFADVLGAARVGRDDNFFTLGGHSLLATETVGRIRAAFGVELPIRALFEAPTPAGLVGALGTARPARAPVVAVSPRPSRVPLSHAQQRLWLLERMGEGGAAYHLPVALRLTGALDRAALGDALTDVVRRHESLRTLIAEDGDGPYQRVLDAATVRVPLTVHTDTDTDTDTDTGTGMGTGTGTGTDTGRAGVRPDGAPFVLERELPVRAELFPAGEDEHTLVLTLHHIAADGWSMGPLLRDLSTAYAARCDGTDPAWHGLPVQYADYALWQRELLGDAQDPESVAGRQLAHWAAVLDGLPAEASFPTDRPRPTRPSGRGGVVPVRVDAAAHRALTELAASCEASTFMVLHAALAALMTRLGAGDDLPVGTPVAGRGDASLTGLVGFFVNTLVLRADTSGAPTFPELVRRLRQVDLAAYAHQDLPFERLVEELAPSRSLARHPLFQVMLALNNVPAPRPALGGLDARHDPSIGRTGAKFDLTWDFTEERDDDGGPAGITGELEFSRDLFDRDTAERFAEHFSRLLGALLEAPRTPFTDVGFLTPEQRAAALDEGVPGPGAPAGDGRGRAGTEESPAAPPGGTVLDALAVRAATTPGRTAVVAADGRLSFADLLERSGRLARLLAAEGVGRGDRVAVALPRSTSNIVAVLGVLRAGAVYVPLDPTHPASRNRVILSTASPRLVVTTPALHGVLPETGRLLLLDGPALPGAADGPLPEPPRPEDAAYVLYTSGSTGRPKGVVVEHRALANLFASHSERLFAPTEAAGDAPLRVALTAAMTFDASFDPLLWMVRGHELHVVDDATRRDPEALTAYLRDQVVDVVETTPSFVEQLRACGLFAPGRPRPRLLALGGEALGGTLWGELADLPDVAVWNLYGPTEATVDSVMGRVTPGARPHLGRAVAGAGARVLDARLGPAAPGTTGELYLTGPGLARGYEGRAPATAERFLPDPYGAPGSRMYRTGDLVRRREGRLEYVGRADGQIKIRGFRVETAEVEAAITGHPGVAQAAVAVRPGADGDGRLVAWVVPCDGQELSGTAVRAYAADRLPRYMVPSAVVPVTALALTVHGKVDFDAMPVLPGAEGDAGHEGAPPRSAREEILCALFAESLGRHGVGREDDFFDLGGHSLMATRLVGRVRAAFGVELPVRTLFESSTPAALALRLDEGGAARPALRAAVRPQHPPLSPAQRRLWFLHGMAPGDPAYHIPVAVTLDGRLDRTALNLALADVVARHESLRTLIKEHGGEPYQAVLDPGDARPDLPLAPVGEEGLAAALRTAAARPFDLAGQIPLRAELFRLADDRHVLAVTVHHIAADGWSMGPLAEDLAGAYAARTAGRGPNWAQLPVQYVDYTLFQRELLGSPDTPDSLAARQLAYWSDRMAGAPEETSLPTDRARPAVSGGGGGTVPLHLPAAVTAGLARLARETSSSTFMVLHAALTALLHRVGGDDDIALGTPVAGRTDEALDGLVGFFVNTLVLRVDATGDPTFRELLGRVRECDLAAYAHQELPFERLVEEVKPVRSLSRHPLFQVMLTLNNTRSPRLELPGLRARLDAVDTGGAKFDLSFSFTGDTGTAEAPQGLDGTLEFSGDLFDRETAERLGSLLVALLDDAVARPGTPLSALRLVDGEEESRLLALGDGGDAGTPATTVLDRFARTVDAVRGDDTAVVAPDGRLSFAELDERSDRVAGLLVSSGVGPGDVVAVLLPRSTESVACLLGVLKAGAVYAPVDRDLPDGRVQAVLDDAAPRLVLATEESVARVSGAHPVLVLDRAAPPETGAGADAGAPGKVLTPPAPHDPAYLIHTSGSTGRPKGVLVGHRSLARLLEHHHREVFTPAARACGRPRLHVALTAAMSFDASWDPLLWMIDGHTLHIVDDLTRRDPEALVEAVRTHGYDVVESTPTHVAQLLDAGLLTPHAHRPAVVALGGEAVPAALWSRLREEAGDDVTCWNLYGPTEATVDTLETRLAAHERPVLGTPVTGTRVHLLDAALRPVPVGVTGDLYLAGESLALGYLNRPAQTAQAFLPDPFGPGGGRMYRTGDRARRTADGELVFAGRSDGQVKIRGFRVEPDEIAAVLASHPDAARAVVVAGDDEDGTSRLAAYVVPANAEQQDAEKQNTEQQDAEQQDTVERLREHASRLLPAYMVPTAWLLLDHIPLTPSGKLDRRALPAATTAAHGGTGRLSPRNPREDVLCTLFAEALGTEKVSIDDDFFALGGHSMLAARLIGRIRTVLGVELSIRSLFEAPTVALLAARLDDGAADDPLATLLPLRARGGRPPLFCVHPATGLAWTYGGLLPYLDDDQPVYGLQVPHLDGTTPFPATMEDLAARYVAELRAVQPHGPYHLLGWSFGGNIVHEVAVQLQDAGEQVALLALLDAFPVAPLDGLDGADRDTMFRALLANLGMNPEAMAGEGPLDVTAVRDEFRRNGSPMGSLEPATLDAMVDGFVDQGRLMRQFAPHTFHGPVLFFTATQGRPADMFRLALWDPYITGHIENHDVPCAHAHMMRPESRDRIGPTVAAALRSLHHTAKQDPS
ncbi:non-ribosomal peptide synthetase [Streptomyces montanisoli]|uniref:Amino acid adenylation domain-containing protein n=1 Tax=Streptomyces montanisoli TaxID=2798581 RepID=A0A940RVY4_9ACTN|nr:non-ribosomal peptide synthetase [Streptomyces montanisoli]MBP0456548.1 amino acid adenylation domain-containing protein [Streptomyces montanisoli]